MNFNLENSYYLIIILAALWTIPWKGIALWRSARRQEKIWFILILLINTLGILEILYIFLFSRKRKPDFSIDNSQ